MNLANRNTGDQLWSRTDQDLIRMNMKVIVNGSELESSKQDISGITDSEVDWNYEEREVTKVKVVLKDDTRQAIEESEK